MIEEKLHRYTLFKQSDRKCLKIPTDYNTNHMKLLLIRFVFSVIIKRKKKENKNTKLPKANAPIKHALNTHRYIIINKRIMNKKYLGVYLFKGFQLCKKGCRKENVIRLRKIIILLK